jgi:hypothetical protein
LLRKLESEGVDATRLAWVDAFCRSYDVIVDDEALPLHERCEMCGDCWETIPRSSQPDPDGNEAAISVPWIGKRFSEHGLCVIGINQNNYGGLGANWWITGGSIKGFSGQSGRRRQFHRDAGRYLVALLAALDSHLLPDEGAFSAAMTAAAWQRCAFTEAIKCSQSDKHGKPSNTMWSNCPPRYLQQELTKLAPKTILVIGKETWDAVCRLISVDFAEYETSFRRGSGLLDGRRVEIFFANHPYRSNWKYSLPRLLKSLELRAPHSE